MDKIRVGNLEFYSSLPYRVLKDLDCVDYREYTPVEAARLLHERQIDIAHIPTTEYAYHGGYVGLEFGLGTKCKVEGVVLFCDRPVSELKRIYVDSRSSSAVALLRVLLADKWMVSPELVRVNHEPLLGAFGGDTGALIIGDDAFNRGKDFPFAVDLTEAWKDLTGLPFVYSLWAFRPEELSSEQCAFLSEVFHKSIAAREILAIDSADEVTVPLARSTDHIMDTMTYYLDPECIAGIQEFFDRAARHSIIPHAEFHVARKTVLDGGRVAPVRTRSVTDILEDAVSGRRISIQDGVYLATGSNLADLGLAADLLRTRKASTRTISYVLQKDELDLQDLSSLESDLETLKDSDVNQIMLTLKDPRLQDLEVYEKFLKNLKNRCDLQVEGFSVPQILELARNTGLEVRDIIYRLIEAGLDAFPADGGELLLDYRMRDRGAKGFNSSDWLNAVKWMHSFGGKSACSMNIGPGETWEERLIHLNKLRFLQDETPGFRYFYSTICREWKEPALTEVKIRATIISRLFLDNVPYIQEVSLKDKPVLGLLSLSFGANEVRIPVASGDQPESLEAVGLLRAVNDSGIDISGSFPDSGEETRVRH